MTNEHMTEELYVIQNAASQEHYWSEAGWTAKQDAHAFRWYDLPIYLDGVGGLWLYNDPGCDPVDAQYQEGCDDRGEPICVARVVEL